MLLERSRRRRKRRRNQAAARETWRREVSMAAHELRNSLNAILGWTQLLATGQDPIDRAEAIDRIRRCANEQARLIDDLAMVARIGVWMGGGTSSLVDLAAVASEAVDDAAPLSCSAAVRLHITGHDGRPLLVLGDRARLRQILWNLLTNAIKFTPAGGHVDVHLARRDTHAIVQIADTGAGIPPDLLPRVFEPFAQATTRHPGPRGASGVGLGLTIARRLAESHGGQLTAHSDGPGKGSTFTLHLPGA